MRQGNVRVVANKNLSYTRAMYGLNRRKSLRHILGITDIWIYIKEFGWII